jgi:hypothetical protein
MVQLVLAGSQDAFFTAKPKRTYFVSVFYRRTPFFLNTINVPFTGPARFGERAICKIPQSGDIVVGMALQASLPPLGTPSTTYTYVGGITGFTMNVNSVEYQIRVPPGATNKDLYWLNDAVPNLKFDSALNITYNGTATINVVSDDNADILCQENPIFTVVQRRAPDYPLDLSPVWSYTTEKKITYVSNTGNKLIKEATLKIGGQSVKRIEGEYLTLKQDLDVTQENQFSLTALVGKNDTQLVTDTKQYTVPLDFIEHLPACSIDRHDLEVEYQFENFSNLIPYEGLGEFSFTSYSNVTIPAPTDAIILSPDIYLSCSSNILRYNGNTYSNIYTNINSGQIRNLYSNLYTYDKLKITKDTGSFTSIIGNAFGSDTQSNLYVFNGNSNIAAVISNALVNTSNITTFNFPPGFSTSTIKYINVSSNTIQTSVENLRITSNAGFTQNSVQITNFTAVPTVSFVSNISWNADYNCNAYFSNSRSYTYNLGTQTTSNTFTIQVNDYTFDWRIRTSDGQTYNPEGTAFTDSLYIDAVNEPRGQANVYYDGNYTSNLTFSYNDINTDPYKVVPTSNSMSATFPYVKNRETSSYRTVTTNNLSTYLVFRATKYIKNPSNPIVSNVLDGYVGMTYTDVSAASNALITYVGAGGLLYSTNITPSDTTINIGSSSYFYRNKTYIPLSTTTQCARQGTRLIFNGPIPIYSVTVNGVPQTHSPVQGFSNVLTFTNVSYPVSFEPSLTITGPGIGRLDDRTQWVADTSNVYFYGTSDLTCTTPGVTKVDRVRLLSNITEEFDRNLVVLSDSTPWQETDDGVNLYFTGEYWTLSQNLWPTLLTTTLYDENNNGTTVTGVTSTEFRTNLTNLGYIDGVTSLTFKNCAYMVCSDIRSRFVLGIGSNVTVPVTYYSSPMIELDTGGRPAYSNTISIPSINARPVTDGRNAVYTASNTSPWILQVRQGSNVTALDTTGVLSPNQNFVSQKNYVTVLYESPNIYFIAEDGSILIYDNTYEFGQVGSISTVITGVPSVKSATLTNRYLVMSQTNTSNLYFANKLTGNVIGTVNTTVTGGFVLWDGARYIYNFSQTDNNTFVIDTILYTDPSFVNVGMLIEYALISEDERAWFRRVEHDHLFKQLQVAKFKVRAGTTEAQYNLKLKNLVSELMFTIDDDGLDSVQLLFNGIPIIDEDAGSALNLSKIQPYEHHARIPDRPFFMYSFAKHPARMDPSGFVNMSRIIDQVISVKFTPAVVDRIFTVWADSYNMIRFRDGLAGVLYDYSEQ